MNRYLAVCVGRRPGVYMDDEEGKAQILHYKGAAFKTFSTEEGAKQYFEDFKNKNKGTVLADQKDEGTKSYADYNAEKSNKSKPTRIDENLVINKIRNCCVIASAYNAEKGIYGYGAVLRNSRGSKFMLQGYGEDRELSALKETAGKILAAETAIKDAKDRGFKELTIITDCDDIASLGIGELQNDRLGIRKYTDTCMVASGFIELKFAVTENIGTMKDYNEAQKLADEAITEEYMARTAVDGIEKKETPIDKNIQFVPSLYDGEKYLYVNDTVKELTYASKSGLRTVNEAILVSVNANDAWFEYYDDIAGTTARLKLPVAAIRAF